MQVYFKKFDLVIDITGGYFNIVHFRKVTIENPDGFIVYYVRFSNGVIEQRVSEQYKTVEEAQIDLEYIGNKLNSVEIER